MNAAKINTVLLGLVVGGAAHLSLEVTQLSKAVSANTAIIERIERDLDHIKGQLEHDASMPNSKRTDRYVVTN